MSTTPSPGAGNDDLDLAYQLVMEVEKRVEIHGDGAPVEALASLAVARALIAVGHELRALRGDLGGRSG
jgi:hypothetical protein